MGITPLRSMLSLFLLLSSTTPLQAAPVFFTDGAAHFVPGDPAFVDDDWIILNGGSTLEVGGPARVTGQPSSAIDVAFGGDAIASAAGTALRVTGGEITGGAATGLLDAASPTAGVVAFAGYAIDAGGALTIEAGSVRGGAAIVSVDPTIDRPSAFSGAGLQLAAATAAVRGGSIESGTALAGGGVLENQAVSAEALVVGSATTLLVDGSTIRAGEARADNALWSEGSAYATGGAALRAGEGTTTVIGSGLLKGGDAFASAGFVAGPAFAFPGSAIWIEDGSRVVIRGGSFSVGIGGAAAAIGSQAELTAAPAIELDVTGSAEPTRLMIFGGHFRGASSLRVVQTDAVPTDAQIHVLGGDLDSTGTVDLDLAHPDVTTIVYGLDLALDGTPIPSGPVTATSGTLSGTLPLGGAFAWTFERSNDAPLQVQVPEPVAGIAAGLVWLAALARRARLAPRLEPSAEPPRHVDDPAARL